MLAKMTNNNEAIFTPLVSRLSSIPRCITRFDPSLVQDTTRRNNRSSRPTLARPVARCVASGLASHIIKRVAFGPGAMNGCINTNYEQDLGDFNAVKDVIIFPLLRFMVERMNPLHHLSENGIITVTYQNWAKNCNEKVTKYGVFSQEYIINIIRVVHTNPTEENRARLSVVKDWLKGVPYDLALIACKVVDEFYDSIPRGVSGADRKLYITTAQGNPALWEEAVAGNHFGRAYRHVYRQPAGGRGRGRGIDGRGRGRGIDGRGRGRGPGGRGDV
jgi:hypothetical protein